MLRLAAAVAVTFALGACAGLSGQRSADVPAARSAPRVNLSGYNAAFKEGYADGCDSVRQAPRRNAKRYGTDTDYTMGWNDGRAMCAR